MINVYDIIKMIKNTTNLYYEDFMSNYFLPKAFDLDINDSYCSSYQYGANTTSLHWHSGAEIIFVVKGEVDFMFNDCWHTLKEGAMLFIPPRQLHRCSCTDAGAEKIVLGFTEKCLGKSGIGLHLPKEINQHCLFENLENTPLPSLIKGFNDCYNNNSLYSKDLIAQAYILQIYAFLIEHWNGLGLITNDKRLSKVSSHIYEYIGEHFAEELSPYEVARELNISYSYLAKEIKKIGYSSFTKCVNQTRIENAKRLLALTDKSVTEIGFECGFSVTSYFIKTFQGFTHMTPKAYRNLINATN